MSPMPRHSGKRVLVTGGASGIGAAIAKRFLDDGAAVAVFDRATIPASLSACLPLNGDASLETDIDAAMSETLTQLGGLDIMVCNAGVISVGQLIDMELTEWERVMRINIDSVFLGARAAARVMRQQGSGGVILNAASGAGRRGVPGVGHYCASKAAVINLTQTLALELAKHRIRVNCYVPGHIDTPFWQDIAAGFAKTTGRSPDDIVDEFRATVPWGRFGRVDEVAATASWLASDDAEYITGQAIAMNGGEFVS